MRYEVAADGAAARSCLDMTDEPGEDAIDGIKVDVDGNLYVCGPGGIWVLSPEASGSASSSCPRARTTWPGATPTARALYVTALTSVYRLDVRPREDP